MGCHYLFMLAADYFRVNNASHIHMRKDVVLFQLQIFHCNRLTGCAIAVTFTERDGNWSRSNLL